MTNNYLIKADLPQFSRLNIEKIETDLDQILADNRAQLEALLSQPNLTWEQLRDGLSQMENRLDNYWSPVRHLNAVKNTPELRKAYDACLPKLSEYSTEIAQNHELYQHFKQVKDGSEFAGLDQANQSAIEKALLHFELGGIALDSDKQGRFKQIKQRLSELKSRFEQNILDATHAWHLHVTEEQALNGIPQQALAMARKQAAERDLPGWVFTLDAPSFLAVMTYCDTRDLRRQMYTAYVTRASDQGPNASEFDNSVLMEDILGLRQELAALLGFQNYAEYSIADKMAESTDAVLDFIYDLADRTHQPAEVEYAEIRRFAGNQGIEDFQAWDLAYYAEKLKIEKFQVSQEDIKPYFPAPAVIQGLFHIVAKLYGIQIREKTGVDTWHEDVTVYEIYNPDGDLISLFYFDLYARKHKRGGAWMDECRNRWLYDNEMQLPVAYLTCNLSPPVDGQPALLTHNEVTTLFHEFGHGLHHMLTRVDVSSVAGINGVEWDAVELPSQFMENFCWDRHSLDLISCHYETGEKLPQELFQRMLASKNFQSAMAMVRQLEFSLFDFRLHMEYGSQDFVSIQALLDQVRDRIAVVETPAFNRFQHGFSHIFAGGYAAGYYSYKWAEVLSADAFALFEEHGVLDPATGKAFLENILQKGGSQKASELFRQFRGRDPRIDALLIHNGLKAA